MCRRDLIVSKRRATHARPSVTAVTKPFAKIATAPVAVGLLFAGYFVPASAGQSPSAISAPVGSEQQVRAIQIARTDIATTLVSARDAHSVRSQPRIAFYSSARTSHNFAPRKSPCRGCSSLHKGLDLTPRVGTPIQAFADGVVSEAGNPSGCFGAYAVIDHVIDGQQVSSLYGHMRRGSLNISVVDTIKNIQIVGRLGSTGASSGPLLHINILLGGTVPTAPFAYLELKFG